METTYRWLYLQVVFLFNIHISYILFISYFLFKITQRKNMVLLSFIFSFNLVKECCFPRIVTFLFTVFLTSSCLWCIYAHNLYLPPRLAFIQQPHCKRLHCVFLVTWVGEHLVKIIKIVELITEYKIKLAIKIISWNIPQ